MVTAPWIQLHSYHIALSSLCSLSSKDTHTHTLTDGCTAHTNVCRKYICMLLYMWTSKQEKRETMTKRGERELHLNVSLPASHTKVWPQPPTTSPKIAAAVLPKQPSKSGQRSRSRRRSTERKAIQFKHLQWHIAGYLNTATAWEATRG